MTQVALTVSGATVGSFTTTYHMTDAEGARVIAAYTAIYGAVEDPPGSGTVRPYTPQEVIDKIASGFLAGVLENTRRHEQAEAANAAAAAVPPIVPLPGPQP